MSGYVFGICGKAGAGKDTIGDYLVSTYMCKRIALADPIKRLVKDVFVLTDKEVYDRVEREKPMPQWNNWSVRRLLQYIGTEMFRNNIDDSIWVKSLWRHIVADTTQKNWVVTDVRFPNELEFLATQPEKRFVSIKVVRDGCEGAVGIQGHASEAYDLPTEFIVTNNGTYADLYKQIDQIISKLMEFDK